YLMQNDTIDVRRVKREYPFNTYSVRNLSYSKGGSSSSTLDLQYITFEGLDTFLVTFNNFIVYSDVVTGFKLRVCFVTCQLLVNKRNSVHLSNIYRSAKVIEEMSKNKFNQ